jgi:transcriptional regulator with XRE-family HTH domain
MKRQNKHLGSSLDDFLREEGLLEEVEGLAAKQAIAFDLQAEVERQGISKSELAVRAGTSRSQIARILSPDILSATFVVVERVASALGKRLVFKLEDATGTATGKAIVRHGATATKRKTRTALAPSKRLSRPTIARVAGKRAA